MRREWRNVLAALIVFPLGAGLSSAQQENVNEAPGSGGELVRVTLEVSWGIPQNKGVFAGGATMTKMDRGPSVDWSWS